MDGSSDRDRVRRAEELIKRLRDVQSCKITTDQHGNFSEIHVVASGDRPPKMIARDVESCLKAKMSMDVDYRKIGVVMIDRLDGEKREEGEWTEEEDEVLESPEEQDVEKTPPPDKSAAGETDEFKDSMDRIIDERMGEDVWESERKRSRDEGTELTGGGEEACRSEKEAPQLEFLEEDVRVRFVSLELGVEEDTIRAEVVLRKGSVEWVGRREDVRTSQPPFRLVAEATLNAAMELLDEKFKLCLSDMREVEISGQRALMGIVDVIRGRSVTQLIGCVLFGREPSEAAVLAVLDALNRPMGRWKSRKEVHYLIK